MFLAAERSKDRGSSDAAIYWAKEGETPPTVRCIAFASGGRTTAVSYTHLIDYWSMEEVSIGDYILTGGELPAMVLIDAVARFIPDVLGNSLSTSDESVYSGLLECDQYTKPRTYQNMEVP